MLIALAIHVVLAFPVSPVRPAILDAAIAEATAITTHHGVDVDTLESPYREESIVVTVNIVDRVNRAQPGVLGSTIFDGDGVPVAVLTIYFDAVRAFVASAHVFGAPEWAWPPDLRDVVTARVLGRVLAHEIGHYVL